MQLNKEKLKILVSKKIKLAINEGHAVEMHRNISGDMVPFGCDSCVEDIGHRIEDATHDRNSCLGRTDSREHYNGVLKVLRRKLRRAKKVNLV
jgi:hypothetical protein